MCNTSQSKPKNVPKSLKSSQYKQPLQSYLHKQIKESSIQPPLLTSATYSINYHLQPHNTNNNFKKINKSGILVSKVFLKVVL